MLVGLTGCSNSPAEDEKANTEVSQNTETENKDEKAKEETKEDANKEEEKKKKKQQLMIPRKKPLSNLQQQHQ